MGYSLHTFRNVQLPHAPHSATLSGTIAVTPTQPGCSPTDESESTTFMVSYKKQATIYKISFFLSVESTALRLITGLGSAEVQPQLSRFLNEPKTLVSAESEELNRALVLTLARSMHVTGTGKLIFLIIL